MSFWQGKRVFITGHNGFKGSWLSLWLRLLGAEVTGYSLPPEAGAGPRACGAEEAGLTSVTGDILDLERLTATMKAAEPEAVFHLAAQPLVRESYASPAGTFAVNVLGTAHVLEAVRSCGRVRAVINVTSDKCYENRERLKPYRETDRLGGRDPYSASKACAELVSEAYRRSFLAQAGVHLATVRSGNVIGGGDWARDRLVPDLIGGLLAGKPAVIRNPDSLRPWQHVLEPLHGYMLLAEHMFSKGEQMAEAWNFGPDSGRPMTVGELARELEEYWRKGGSAAAGGATAVRTGAAGNALHEARLLVLDSSKAGARLGWRPLLSTREAVRWTADWYKAFSRGEDTRAASIAQIKAYERRKAQ